jgi:DNA helicase-2/ATP-dependent DNA helicase PcrA
VLTLQRNYRSTQPLLAAANAVIAQASQRFAKTLWSDKASLHKPQLVHVHDEADQARWVADEVLRQREEGTRLTQQAVLFRTSHHSAALELELARRAHPVREVRRPALPGSGAHQGRGVAAALDAQPALPAGGLSRRAAGQRHRPGRGAAAAGRDGRQRRPGARRCCGWMPPPRAPALDWLALRDTCSGLMARRRPGRTMAPAVAWLQPSCRACTATTRRVRSARPGPAGRLAAGYPSRERFLTELTLDPPEASSDEAGPPHRDEDYLILSTIHSAKGQEWHSVHVLNVVDGCMPALILDHVYQHEAAQPDRVFLTQPVGGGEVVDYTWAQVLDQARRMAAHLQSLRAAAAAPASRCWPRTARTSSWPSWPSGWPAAPRWRSSRPRPPTRGYVLSTARPACCSSASSTPGTAEAGIPAGLPCIALPLAPPRWPTGRAATPGTPSSRARRRCPAGRSARPTTWPCCSTPRAPPASPRA